MKITVVGAGAVGASSAEYIAIKNFASEVVLLDIKENFAEGKAMDLMQTSSLNYFDTKITGCTNDYSKTKNSDIAVITSGIPRKPGMSREELIGINSKIVKDIFVNKSEIKIFNNHRFKTKNTHGTGCTLSSAITAFLSCGKPIKKSCELGIKYVNFAIKTNPNYGKGHGPINHLNSVSIIKKLR